MKNLLNVIILFISTLAQAQTNSLESWKYLGQQPPGDTARIFAPGIVTTGLPTRDIAITPDGKEIYFTVHGSTYLFSTILCTKYTDGKWTRPEVAPFAANSKFNYTEPCISPDGKKMFFVSNRFKTDLNGSKQSYDIWEMNRTGNEWSEPQNIGSPVNSDADEYFPSVTIDGTIYFTREGSDRSNAIYRSKIIDGKFSDPEKLPAQVNSGVDRFNAFIAPDESYIIVSVFKAKDGKGATDYYIVYRNLNDSWEEPINLGDKINSAFNEYSPYVSRDGKFFFFMSMKPDAKLFPDNASFSSEGINRIYNSPGNGNNTIYWIDAKVIPARISTK
jgi:hypothetical protein